MMTQYFRELLFPLGIVAASVALGFLLQKFATGLAVRFMDRKNWKIGRRLMKAFRVVLPVWLGLVALRAVIYQLPLKPTAVPLFEHCISAVIVLTIAVFIGRVVVAFIRTFSGSDHETVTSISLIENAVRAVIYVFGLLGVFRVFNVAVTPLLTALGVGGLAVALALQDTLSNFFAGIHIILSKQFDPGDYIKLETGQEGVINDINWRLTTLRTSAGTLVLVPNSKFVTSIITNFDRTEKSIRLVIPFTLEPTSDIDRFEEIALRAANEVAGEQPEAVMGTPMFDYTSIMTKDGTTVSVVVNVSEFSKQNQVKGAILRKIHKYLPLPKDSNPLTSQQELTRSEVLSKSESSEKSN